MAFGEFRGEILAPLGLAETCQRGGHIPGASNIPWACGVDPDYGTFKSPAELASIYGGTSRLSDMWWQPLQALLSEGNAPQNADMIFVLAGHRRRKVYAARLFAEGWAPRLVTSTVNPSYIARVLEREVPEVTLRACQAAGTIREAASQPYPDASEERLCFVSLDERGWSVRQVPVTPLGTLTEIRALADWLRERPDVRSVLVVSAGMHLKRIRMCCRYLLPRDRAVHYVAVSGDAADGTPLGGHPPREGPKEVALEFAKLALYRTLFLLTGGRGWS